MTVLGQYASAAARLAETCHPVNDPGKTTLQLDTDSVYRCICGGTGETCWEALYPLDDLTFSIPLSLFSFREVDANGDIGNAAANGGLLASDTTPALEGDANGSQQIRWVTGNADAIAIQVPLPFNFAGWNDVTGELWVYSGSTDAATFAIKTSWDAAAIVTDSADDSATKSATVHKITFTVAAADIPDTARNLTLILTPPAHATNAIQLTGAALMCERYRVA
jgi:hypothetical protein